MSVANLPAGTDLDRSLNVRNCDSATTILQRGGRALRLLWESRCYARELDRNEWDFAVDLSNLTKLGLSISDCRWLLCKGYAAQKREIKQFDEPSRSFREGGGLTFTRDTCFILLDAGLSFVRPVVAEDPHILPLQPAVSPQTVRGSIRQSIVNGQSNVNGTASGGNTSSPMSLVPSWNRDRQQLWMAGVLVKQFKVPAPNQETVLAVFEEEGWPDRIDDPLSPQAEVEPKGRLHDTINSLNRRQKTRLIQFRGDGSGTGILWEPIAETLTQLSGQVIE